MTEQATLPTDSFSGNLEEELNSLDARSSALLANAKRFGIQAAVFLLLSAFAWMAYAWLAPDSKLGGPSVPDELLRLFPGRVAVSGGNGQPAFESIATVAFGPIAKALGAAGLIVSLALAVFRQTPSAVIPGLMAFAAPFVFSTMFQTVDLEPGESRSAQSAREVFLGDVDTGDFDAVKEQLKAKSSASPVLVSYLLAQIAYRGNGKEAEALPTSTKQNLVSTVVNGLPTVPQTAVDGREMFALEILAYGSPRSALAQQYANRAQGRQRIASAGGRGLLAGSLLSGVVALLMALMHHQLKRRLRRINDLIHAPVRTAHSPPACEDRPLTQALSSRDNSIDLLESADESNREEDVGPHWQPAEVGAVRKTPVDARFASNPQMPMSSPYARTSRESANGDFDFLGAALLASALLSESGGSAERRAAEDSTSCKDANSTDSLPFTFEASCSSDRYGGDDHSHSDPDPAGMPPSSSDAECSE